MLQLNWNLVFEIINLIILCLLLKKFLIKPVTAVMDKRQAMISDGLSNARNSEAQADELKNRYEAALRDARNESGRLIEEAKKRAQEESDRILKEAGDQAADIMRKAEKNIENEREKTIIIRRYGLNGKEPMTQSELADRLGISRSYISRIEKKALLKLKKLLEDAKL